MKQPGEFGFSNDPAWLAYVRNFRDAAVADGWQIKPTYGESEAQDRAATLNRDGYTMMVLTREPPSPHSKWKYEASVNLWCPNGIAIKKPDTYSFAAIQANARNCSFCGAKDVPTGCVAFASRACLTCQPIEQAKLPDNWCD